MSSDVFNSVPPKESDVVFNFNIGVGRLPESFAIVSYDAILTAQKSTIKRRPNLGLMPAVSVDIEAELQKERQTSGVSILQAQGYRVEEKTKRCLCA